MGNFFACFILTKTETVLVKLFGFFFGTGYNSLSFLTFENKEIYVEFVS